MILTSPLRWVGGKRHLVHRLTPFLPSDLDRRTYIEPFLGAASVFLAAAPKRALLGDANAHLINTFAQIRARHRRVHVELTKLARRDSAAHYYRVRDVYNRGRRSAKQAARFIYLNRTCFNGVFRVNQAGKFNVPYGYRPSPTFPDLEQLKLLGERFRKARLVCSPYQETLRAADLGDFVYLDPPYPALNGTSFFAHYTSERFVLAEQEALAEEFFRLDALGCLLMMTNADTPAIRSIYKGFTLRGLRVTRWVTSSNVKHRVRELVITNYAHSGAPVRGGNGA